MPEPAPQSSFSWGGSRYAFADEKLPWPEARKRAEEAGGSLAVFETEAEERAIREFYLKALNRQPYWIGGHVEQGSKEILWITGEPVGKLAWGAGHPDWRYNPNAPDAQSAGLLFAGALAVSGIQKRADQWMIIQPQAKTSLGFIIEWNEVPALQNPE